MLRGMSANTIEKYLFCARRFAEHFGRSLCRMGAAEIRAFLLHLARERGRSPSTVDVYAGALRFLYGVTLERPERMPCIPRMRVPVVLSGTEVERLLAAIGSERHRLAAMLAYGAGLRVGEVCKLRTDDVDPKRMVLRVRASKRGRERYVMLSPRLLSAMRRVLEARAAECAAPLSRMALPAAPLLLDALVHRRSPRRGVLPSTRASLRIERDAAARPAHAGTTRPPPPGARVVRT